MRLLPLYALSEHSPAYTALNGMGFKKLRVLALPTDFATGWVGKGHATQKGM